MTNDFLRRLPLPAPETTPIHPDSRAALVLELLAERAEVRHLRSQLRTATILLAASAPLDVLGLGALLGLW